MDPLYADAPTPTLVIDGHHATISGIRFTHMAHCGWCLNAYHVATEGGTITLGLTDANQPRWYQKDRAGAKPAVPANCPNCGHALLPHRNWDTPLPVFRTVNALLDEVWCTLRAKYPKLSKPADRAAGIAA